MHHKSWMNIQMNEPHGINIRDTTIQIFTPLPILQNDTEQVCKTSRVIITRLQYLQII
jgi:hypothetical protein